MLFRIYVTTLHITSENVNIFVKAEFWNFGFISFLEQTKSDILFFCKPQVVVFSSSKSSLIEREIRIFSKKNQLFSLS